MSKCNANTKSITRSVHLGVQSEDPQVIQEHYQSLREEMTRILPEGHPVQLTLLWEYVIRMKQFPSNVDPQLVFHEILERLKDPEWQVRQHALRVLVDIFPTLSADVIDANMQSIVPELVSNLGHPTPAVRKGSLDALRIYLLYGNDNNRIVQNIFTELNREELDNFHTNVKIGIILSIPLLLYPSKKSEGPSRDVLKQITLALTDRLVDVMYQKAAVRTLMKIKNIVGNEEFDSYFTAVNDEMKSHFNILCNAYNLNSPKRATKEENKVGIAQSLVPVCKNDENDDRTEKPKPEETSKSSVIPPSRVLLETEIKFDKNTAITMTLLEEKKNKEIDKSSDDKRDTESSVNKTAVHEKPKISRRVHFGGEEIKLRTPESEDSDSFVKDYPQSRIPLPLSPATKIPRYRKSLMNLNTCEDFVWKSFVSSLSGNRKSEAHVHDSSLNPKKSILSGTNSAATKPSSMMHQNVIHSPKREVVKKDEKELSPQTVDYNQKITIDDIPAGSFKIFSEKENGDSDSCQANRDFSHDRSTLRKNRKSLSATAFAGTEEDLEKKNVRSVKNRGGSLDRKMSKEADEVDDEKSEMKGTQKTSEKKIRRYKSVDKLADTPQHSEKVDYCILRDLKNSNEDRFQDDLNGHNFEILQDDNVGDRTPLSRRKSELIKSDIFKQPNHDEYSYMKSHNEDIDFDLHIW